MGYLVDIIRFMTVGCLFLLAIRLLQSGIIRRHAWSAAAFALGLICYLLVDWPPMSSFQLFYLLLPGAFAVPFSFWLFSQAMFNDHFRLKYWMFWALMGVIIVEYFLFGITYEPLWGISFEPGPIAWVAMHSISLLFVVLGILAAANDWKADLISARLRFRTIFLILSAVLLVVTLLAEIAFQREQPPPGLELLHKFVIAALVYYFALHRLELKPGFFLLQPQEAEKEKPDVDQSIIREVEKLMNKEKFWQTEGLTIRQTAEKMEVKEYKLRQAINQHLGFRNFNDFLNSYRVEEACRILSDPAQKERTVLEIAFALGYQSLSPFNKAFKFHTGMTPTQWRKEKSGQ